MKELANKTIKIELDVKIQFDSAVLPRSVIQEYHNVLLYDGDFRAYYPCPNDDCTGDGFTLNSEIERMLSSKSEYETGTKYCTGKEDSKYQKRQRGSSCDTRLDYEIKITYQ